ncbi:MAG: FecR domain-containing protein [Spirochaetes bacterium]|nr:FecR domain-containing protein [Spirochaetota bacterium]
MRRIFILPAALLLLIACQKQAPIGTVIGVKGSVTVEGRAATAGMPLVEGALVTVNEGGRIDLSLLGGHRLRLKEGALRLSRPGSNYLLSLPQGRLLVAVNKLAAGQRFDLNTPTTIAGVRGTMFLLEEKTNVGYVCVCEGVVETASVGSPEQRQKVSQGEDLWVKATEPAAAPVASPMMYKMTKADFIEMGVTP